MSSYGKNISQDVEKRENHLCCIDLGQTFIASDYDLLSGFKVNNYFITAAHTVSSTDIEEYYTLDVKITGIFSVSYRLYEGSVIGGQPVDIPVYNLDRNSANAPFTTIGKNSGVITTLGTQIDTSVSPFITEEDTLSSNWVLKTDENYIFRVKNETVVSNPSAVQFLFRKTYTKSGLEAVQ